MDFMCALLESWPAPVLLVAFFVLLDAVARVAGETLAFARAKERLHGVL